MHVFDKRVYLLVFCLELKRLDSIRNTRKMWQKAPVKPNSPCEAPVDAKGETTKVPVRRIWIPVALPCQKLINLYEAKYVLCLINVFIFLYLVLNWRDWFSYEKDVVPLNGAVEWPSNGDTTETFNQFRKWVILIILQLDQMYLFGKWWGLHLIFQS